MAQTKTISVTNSDIKYTRGGVYLEPYVNYERGSGQVWSHTITDNTTGNRVNFEVTLSQRYDPVFPEGTEAKIGARFVFPRSLAKEDKALYDLQSQENIKLFAEIYKKNVNDRTDEEKEKLKELYKVYLVGSVITDTVRPSFSGNNVSRKTVTSSSSLVQQNVSTPLYSYTLTSDLEVRTGNVTSAQSSAFNSVLAPDVRSKNGVVSLILSLRTQDFGNFSLGLYNFFSDSASKNKQFVIPKQNDPLYKLITVQNNVTEISFSLNLSNYINTNFPTNFPITIRLYGFQTSNTRDVAQAILSDNNRNPTDETELRNISREWRYKEYRFSLNLIPASLPLNPRKAVNTLTNTSSSSNISSAIRLRTPDPGSFDRIVSRKSSVLLFDDVNRIIIPDLQDDSVWDKTLIRTRVLNENNSEIYQDYVLNRRDVSIPVATNRGRINLTPLYVRSENDLQSILAGARNLPSQANWGQTFDFEFEKIPRTTTSGLNDPNDIIGKIPLPSIKTSLNFAVPEGSGVVASRPAALSSGVDVATRVRGKRVRLRLDTGNTATQLDAVKVEKNSVLVGYFEDKSIIETQLASNVPTVFTVTPVRFASIGQKTAAINGSLESLYITGEVAGPVSPNYRLFTTSNRVTEGETFTVTLNTDFVADGTKVPYKIYGIGADDILESLVGEFEVNSNVAIKTFTVLKDYKIEGTQAFQLVLDNKLAFISVLIQDQVFNFQFENQFPEFDIGLFDFDDGIFGRF